MGFLDEMRASLDRTAADANRALQVNRIKSQMNDALKRRQQLAGQLGASLYEATKDNTELRQGREELFDGIAAIDNERAQLQAQIDELERQAQAAAYASAFIDCPFCHNRLQQSSMFCSGCGKSMAEIQAELARQAQAAPTPVEPQVAPADGAAVCPACGAPIQAGHAFCMNCGHKLA